MSKTNPKVEAKGDPNELTAKIKSKFGRIEPGLVRYRASGVYYSILKRDGKTTRNMQASVSVTRNLNSAA